jgi:autotransporter-associated beta strand protein
LLGNAAGTSGSYLQNGPNVTLNFWFRMGLGGADTAGYAELDAGTLAVGGRLNVAENGAAVFTMNGGTLTTGDHLAVGGGGDGGTTTGNGVFNQTNGSVTVGNEFWVGNNDGAVGTVNLSGSASVTVNNWVAIGRRSSTGVLNLSGNATFTKAGGNVITFAGVVNGASPNGTLNQSGSATVNCANNDTWLGEDGTGTWNMTNGTTTIATLQFGRNATATGNFNLKGGVLSANQITLGAGVGTLNFNGGTLRPRAVNANFMSGVAGVLQAGGAVIDSQGFNITISSILADGGGGSLTKLGSGTLTLSGANTYTGSTIVSAGKLVEDTASLATGAVSVANTAGYGVNVSVANGQVNHGNVTLSGAANTLDFSLGNFGNPTLAPLNVTAVLNINGTTTVNVSDALPQVGQFPLIKYVSKTGAGSFVLGTLPPGVSATLVNNTGNNSIDLNITSTAFIRWDGRVAGGVWDINTTTNWTDYVTTLPAKFTTGAAVVFDDVALGTTTANLGVTVNPGAVTVTNDALPYTFTGVGSISGATGLVKQGTNSLTIATTNGYTGATVISGGTLNITKLADGGAPSAIGSSSSGASNLVFNGGTLRYSGPAVITDRGYSLNPGNSGLDVQGDMTFNGALTTTVNGNFAKSGNATLYVKRPGANTLSSGGGGGAYNIVNGGVVMDGSSGAQVNTVNGEVWAGGTTNSTGGNLILTNTTLNVSSWLAISRGSGTGGYTSSVSVYNSKLRSGNFSMSFDNGVPFTLQTGVLTLNGSSTYTNTGDSNIGESAGGTAIINLNDSSVFSANNREMVGWHGGGTGVVTVANSAKIVVNAWMSIGNEGGTGTVLLKDSSSLTCGDLNVCDVNTGLGTLIAQNNSQINAGNMWVGKGNGSTGFMLITNNATVVSANGLTVAQGVLSVGTVDLGGGSLSVNLLQGVPAATSTAIVNFNGGKLIAHPPYFGPDFVFGLSQANVMAGGAVIQIDNADIRNIPQDLQAGDAGNGGLTKLGTGTLLLGGNNSYTGSTVASAGTLGGSGSIAGPVTIQSTATLSPGGGVSNVTLTVNNNLTIAGNLLFAVNETNTPATNDSVVVTGTLNNTGAGTTLKVVNLGPPLNVGDSFTLFSKPLVNGSALTVSGSGVVWNNKLAVDGSIQVVSVVPSFTSGGAARLPDGNIALTANGAVGSTYKLWATTNLALSPISSTWTLLSSGTVTTSPFTINDLTATNFTRRFYIFSAP